MAAAARVYGVSESAIRWLSFVVVAVGPAAVATAAAALVAGAQVLGSPGSGIVTPRHGGRMVA